MGVGGGGGVGGWVGGWGWVGGGGGGGSNTIYQIQIQKIGFFKIQIFCSTLIKIQIHRFKYKYNTFNQKYLPKLFRSKIGQFYESQDIFSWPVFPYVSRAKKGIETIFLHLF